jgi:hypothetical protein
MKSRADVVSGQSSFANKNAKNARSRNYQRNNPIKINIIEE